MNLSVEHVLMIVLVAFALHYLMGNCGCRRVEGVSIKNRKEGDCCNMGECGGGLACNLTAMTSKCLREPGKDWYGACSKKDIIDVTEDVGGFIWGEMMKGGMPVDTRR